MTEQQNSGRTFRPARDGLGKVLGELEAEVMESVWTADPEPVTAREIAEVLGPKCDVQYITLVTVLNNLVRKGLLSRAKSGKAFQYHVRLTRESFVAGISREVMAGLIGLGPELAVNSFVDVLRDEAPAELERLKSLLVEKRKQEEGG